MFFAFLPPEVNSGLMYSGPGSAPLAAAASAWDSLATELYTTASSYESVLSTLTSGWRGPSATAMASAAAPYVTWMATTAAQAADAGAQVAAGTAAYESAYAATVPPAVIAANRAALAALVASNIFGQNTPAIFANETQYLEMWAQDVAAMNGYAAASSGAIQVSAFSAPPATTNSSASSSAASSSAASTSAGSGAAIDGAGALAGLTNLGTELQSALGALSATAPAQAVLGALSADPTQEISLASQFGMYPVQTLIQLVSTVGQTNGSGLASSGTDELLTTIGSFVDEKMQAVVGGISNQLQTFGSSVSAQLAHASQLGGLSIPPGWSGAAHGGELVRATSALPANSISTSPLSQAAAVPTSPFSQGLAGALGGEGPTSITGKMPPAKIFARTPAGG